MYMQREWSMNISLSLYRLFNCSKNVFAQTFLGKSSISIEDTFVLKLLSYNILAQHLLDTHSYLYTKHNPKTLSWKVRKPLVIQEILEAEANVCTYTSVLNHVKFET